MNTWIQTALVSVAILLCLLLCVSCGAILVSTLVRKDCHEHKAFKLEGVIYKCEVIK